MILTNTMQKCTQAQTQCPETQGTLKDAFEWAAYQTGLGLLHWGVQGKAHSWIWHSYWEQIWPRRKVTPAQTLRQGAAGSMVGVTADRAWGFPLLSLVMYKCFCALWCAKCKNMIFPLLSTTNHAEYWKQSSPQMSIISCTIFANKYTADK